MGIFLILLGILLWNMGKNEADLLAKGWIGPENCNATIYYICAAVFLVLGVIFLYNKSKKSSPISGIKKKNTSAAYYYTQIEEVMKRCYNEQDKSFNWKLYFDGRDKFIHSGIPEVNEYLQDEFKYIGRKQIDYLNALLYQRMYAGEYEQLKRDLNAKEENIIRNLGVMWCGGENKKCPEKIARYQKELYNIMRGTTPIPRTKEEVDRIIGSVNLDW